MSGAALPIGPHSINGVAGRFGRFNTRDGERIAKQAWWSEWRRFDSRESIRVRIGHEDGCRNGHPSFSVTADSCVTATGFEGSFGGCCHEYIAQFFPELAPLIRWHLCGTDGPMHYVGNTLWHAGDRDCHGLRKGETRQIRFGGKEPCWELRVDDGSPLGAPLYTLARGAKGDAPPLDVPRLAWRPWCHVGEGKPRDLAAARSCAVWPDATDAELTAEPDVLRAALAARLPALIDAMRADVTAAGFAWE